MLHGVLIPSVVFPYIVKQEEDRQYNGNGVHCDDGDLGRHVARCILVAERERPENITDAETH